MVSDTFKTRLLKLINKSRKAVRVYSNAGGASNFRAKSKPYADMQLKCWRDANERLVEFLHSATKNMNLRKVASEILAYAKQCQQELENREKQLEKYHHELLTYSQNKDYVNAAIISNELIVLKANVQAEKAVLEELEDVLTYANVKLPATYSSSEEDLSELCIKETKIIPFPKAKNRV